MTIQVKVEVTDEIVKVGDKEKQIAYLDLGGRYPEKSEIWVNNGKARQPGTYIATNMRKAKYDFVLDLDRLQPAPAGKG